MRVISAISGLLLLLSGSLAAKKPTNERWNDFHSKSLSSTPLKLKETAYKSLTASPRDYSVGVLLTALETRFGCQLCQDFQPEWDIIAKSWIQGDKKAESRMLFGTLDFADGRDVFISLNLQTAPVLLFFPPTEGPHSVSSPDPIRYDFTSGPPTADAIHAWIARQMPDRPHPAIKRPVNWFRWGSTITIGLGLVTLMVTAWPYMLPIVQHRNVWASFSLIAILLFTSGHMFNHIRKVPYVSGDGRGGVTYFTPSFQSQLGLETQIVAAIYGVMAFCVICLTVKVPRMADAKSQTVGVLAWGGVLFVAYSFLLSIFRIKNGSYPFSLPPFM